MKLQAKQILVTLLLGSCSLIGADPVLIPGQVTKLHSLSGGQFSQGLAIDPNNPRVIYWCIPDGGGLQKSTNSGETFTKLADIQCPIHVRIDPNNSNYLYTVEGVRGGHWGFWRSFDGGNTWNNGGWATVVGSVGSDCYDVSADPTDFNHIIISFHSAWSSLGGNNCGFLESKDGGTTFRIVQPDSRMSGPGYGISFLYEPSLGIGDANTWLVGCQGSGFFRTTDAGETWAHVDNSPMSHGGNQIYYTRSGVLYSGGAGYPACPMSSTDNGATWHHPTNIPGGNSSSALGVGGDGYHVYFGNWGGGPLTYSSEADVDAWQAYPTSPAAIGGGFEFAYDKTNKIMYFTTAFVGDLTGFWALKVIVPDSGIVFANAKVTPSRAIENTATQITVSADVTDDGSIGSVVCNLSAIGGGTSVAMAKSGNTYAVNYTLPAGLYAGTRNIVITATDNHNNTASRGLTFEIADASAPMLVSRGQPVVASSSADATVAAANAVDGNDLTRWASGNGDPQWIYVDLGAPTKVTRVVLSWETAYASGYKIQVSDNATSWTDVFTTTTGNGGLDTCSFAPVDARYVRMYGTARGTQFGYSLYEFKVFSPATGVTRSNHSNSTNPVSYVKRPALTIMDVSSIKGLGQLYDVKGQRVSAGKVAHQAIVIRNSSIGTSK